VIRWQGVAQRDGLVKSCFVIRSFELSGHVCILPQRGHFTSLSDKLLEHNQDRWATQFRVAQRSFNYGA